MKLSIQNVVDWMERANYHFGCHLVSNDALFSSVSLCSEYDFNDDVLYVLDFSEQESTENIVYIVTKYGDVLTVTGIEPYELFNSLIDIFDAINLWESRLLQSVLERSRLEVLGSIGDYYFQGPAFLLSPDGYPRPLNSTYEPFCTRLWSELNNSEESLENILKRRNGGEEFISKDRKIGLYKLKESGDAILYAPVKFSASEYGCIIILQYNKLFKPGDITYLEILAMVIEQYVRIKRESYFYSGYIEQYVRSLISATNMSLAKRSIVEKRHPWIFESTLVMYFFKPLAKCNIFETGVIKRIYSLHLPYAIYITDQHYNLIVITKENTTIEDTICKEISDCFRIPVSICKSSQFHSLENVVDRYKACSTAITYCNSVRSFITEDDVIAEELRRVLSKDENLKAYVHPSLRILHAYDKRDGTRLLETLRYFVFYECNYSEAAKALHISRNTLISQIETIKRLTNIDFDDVQTYQAVLLSFIFYEDSEKY